MTAPAPSFYDPLLSYEENYRRGPFGLMASLAPAQPVAPKHEFLGLKLSLPLSIAAGPLLNGRFVQAALDWSWPLATYKTVRSRFWPSHPWPNVLPVQVPAQGLGSGALELLTQQHYSGAISITNSFGVPSQSPEVWQPDMAAAAAYARAGQAVIGSFQGTVGGGEAALVADFALTARLVAQTGVPVLEANFSCPNEGTHQLLCFDVERSEKVCRAIKQAVPDRPLILKIASFAEDEHLRQFLRRVGPMVEAISAINTVPAAVRTPSGEQALPGAGRLVSGICGAAIFPAAQAMCRRLLVERERLGLRFAVIATGGVSSVADDQLYRQLGADAVSIATAAMWRVQLGREILETLE